MEEENRDTIIALATAPAPSGIAVVRVSGNRAKQSLKVAFSSREDPASDPRRMVFGRIIDEKGGLIDQALAVFMPAPNSYTGEDVVEFQFHGSPVAADRLISSLLRHGFSMAEPGEFTKRAFLNGKLDLLQAEAVADLIDAGSVNALRVAEEQLEGRFSRAIEEIGEPLRDALSEVEAILDFPEENIQPSLIGEIIQAAAHAAAGIDKLVETYRYGMILREGFRVLLCGEPNAGKSTLFNRLLGRPRAIVTEISGTTRDVLEEHVLIDRNRFVICDSAGIRRSTDRIEAIGIELALERLEWADLAVYVCDAAGSGSFERRLPDRFESAGKPVWLVWNKVDVRPGPPARLSPPPPFSRTFSLSALTGQGVEDFQKALVKEVSGALAHESDANVLVTNDRQRECLLRARECLERAMTANPANVPPEIISEDLRGALRALEEIIGKTWSEDILGRIFSRFCIGK